jgi:hypothetical protein
MPCVLQDILPKNSYPLKRTITTSTVGALWDDALRRIANLDSQRPFSASTDDPNSDFFCIWGRRDAGGWLRYQQNMKK